VTTVLGACDDCFACLERHLKILVKATINAPNANAKCMCGAFGAFGAFGAVRPIMMMNFHCSEKHDKT
jgi:hypothetical protein